MVQKMRFLLNHFFVYIFYIPMYMSLTATINTAKERSKRIVLGFVCFEIFAPSCAPTAAPMPMQMAGSQTT